jgi:CRP/FNR family transcriptional activator FtrB
MPESHYADVRSLHFFHEMADESFERLMRAAYVQTFPPMVEIVREGDHSDFFHVVVSGSVELFSSWNGRETSMATVRPISSFILAATIRDAPYLMSGRTLEKSRLVLIPSRDVRAVFQEDANFARAIVAELAQCYRSVVKSQKDMKLRTSLERLANYLLRQQNKAGGAETFELDITKTRMASRLGMTPENLSRALKGLQPYGVSVNGASVTIADRRDLEQFARPSPLIDDYTT